MMKRQHIEQKSAVSMISRNSVVFEVLDFVELSNLLIRSSQAMRKSNVSDTLVKKVCAKGHEYRGIVKPLVKGKCWKSMIVKYPNLRVNIEEYEAEKLCVLLSTIIVNFKKIGTENTDLLSVKVGEIYTMIEKPLSIFKYYDKV